MDRVEQAVVRQALRLLTGRESDHIGVHSDVAAQLLAAGKANGVKDTDADAYLYTKGVRQSIQDKISDVGLSVLAKHMRKVISYFLRVNPDILTLLMTIFRKEYADRREEFPEVFAALTTQTASSRTVQENERAIDIIFSNWDRPIEFGFGGGLRTGLYQVFRRYKPTRAQKTNKDPEHDWSTDENHAIICELWFINLENRECRLVTGDLNFYHGSLFVTHESILYVLFQRTSEEANRAIHQRIYATRIELTDYGMYSGICLKVGNISHRPIAADMFFMPIPPLSHNELYGEFTKLLARKYNDSSLISADSIVADYVAITPPANKTREHPDWQRVKYLKHFEGLNKIGHDAKDYIALFREPLRTLDGYTLNTLLTQISVKLFRHSDPPN